MAELPKVLDCSVDACAYNKDNACATGAVTIAGKADASCATFIPLNIKGGLDRVSAFVGACVKDDCAHNEHLECTAASVRIGADDAECLTYAAR